MSDPTRSDPERPVVESSPTGGAYEVTRRTLDLRIRQQEILAELGVVALSRCGFEELLQRAVELAAKGLEAELCKVLEYLSGENRFLLRAGVGWNPGLVGSVTVGADLESPSGFALRTGKPVISNHLEHEERFRTPELLKVHGVKRAINVILQGDGVPYGVLEVDSRSEGEFSEHDIAFLQGSANILGMAIERQRYERNLKAALDHQKVLMSEINHRVKNSLQLVASLLKLQAAGIADETCKQNLQDAVGRISAVARIHERLYRTSDIGQVDLAGYLDDIGQDLTELMPECDLTFSSEGPVLIATDRAVRAALLVTELIANAAKHAYLERGRGPISVKLLHVDERTVALSVRDAGRGLPVDFGMNKKGLGMRIVGALVEQMGATLEHIQHKPGTEFRVTFSLKPAAA